MVRPVLGVLRGLLFFVPLLGAAFGAAVGYSFRAFPQTNLTSPSKRGIKARALLDAQV